MVKTDVTHSQSEDVLAAHVRLGDITAFTTVFRTYYPAVLRFIKRYLPEDSAEDIAQDVFVRLWDNRANIDPDRSLRAFLFVSARNQTLNVLAHDEIVRQHAEAALQSFTDTPDQLQAAAPDTTLLSSELVYIAESRVGTLSPRLQEIYYLSRHDGLSAPEIAETLGTSIQTVYNQLSKIVQALHPVLQAWMDE
jgi:RNA polymerase sigma-70 factor (ECF subfamily)